MALINTDWTKELAQVEVTMNKILDEKIDPMLNRALDHSVKEIDVTLNNVSFEIQEVIKQLALEIEKQKNDFIKKLTFLVVGVCVFVVILNVFF